jgi:hypothetical protein
MMFLKVDKTLDLSSTLTIVLTTLSAQTLRTCHKHKNTLALGQMLLQMQAWKLNFEAMGSQTNILQHGMEWK